MIEVKDEGKENTVRKNLDLESQGALIAFRQGFGFGVPCNNEILIGRRCRISRFSISIWGSNHRVVIGNDVSLAWGHSILIKGDRNTVSIGNDFVAGADFRIVMNLGEGRSITVGEGCRFSRNVLLCSDDGHNLFDLSTNEIINPPKDVTVENRVLICDSVFLLKGSYIKEGSIVGAHSVVTSSKRFPNNSVIAGNPAGIIRERVRWGQ